MLVIFFLQAVLASLAIGWVASAIRVARRERREARLRFESAHLSEAEGDATIAGRVESQGEARDTQVVQVESHLERVSTPWSVDPITGGLIRVDGARFAVRAREVRLAPFLVVLDDGRRVGVRADTELTLLAPPAWKKSAGGWVGISTLRAGDRALVRGVLQRAAGDGAYREVVDAFEIGASPERRLVIESSAHAPAIAREKGPGLLAPALTLVGLAVAAFVATREPPAPWVRRLPSRNTRVGEVVDVGSRGLSLDLGGDHLIYVRTEGAWRHKVGDWIFVTCAVPFCRAPLAVREPPDVPDPRSAQAAGALVCFVLVFVVLAIRSKRRLAAAERRLATW